MTASATELRDLARTFAHEGAELARTMRREGIEVADTKTSAVDVVTEADRAVEALIRSRITALRPEDAILGEEGDDRAGTSGVRWVVDPIDGTVNYLYGLPDCAVSIAAEVDGEVVAGAVVTIPTGTEYAAALGHGATRDDRPIAVRPSPPLAERLVLTGFGYQRVVREHQADCVARLLPEVRDIRRMGSCSLDLCHVAEGSGDGYVEAGPQPWDWSAGGLVLREAGGRFALLDGTFTVGADQVRNVVVGAPADGWDTFVGALGAAGFLA
ncbi:putative inositol-1-monophosphatase SuhB [Nocardioides flavus (ex Wang et al. 2016)]|uniref:Inositol-1-monophosphatase n=1 Tax=Nocardioides flavus (ex Wang et al. 2016) TaxID=2058780 RepID=A0ABQ3HU59_9ACTN|nr:inositol monophosphatase family protein [Nocardioides flavus (ex Wang et al. 2016)]GHE19454.1 putative inositol-1-monophosphatase SuhB [Nocardioides flavus (ex Wang et al. 2016)]